MVHGVSKERVDFIFMKNDVSKERVDFIFMKNETLRTTYQSTKPPCLRLEGM